MSKSDPYFVVYQVSCVSLCMCMHDRMLFFVKAGTGNRVPVHRSEVIMNNQNPSTHSTLLSFFGFVLLFSLSPPSTPPALFSSPLSLTVRV